MTTLQFLGIMPLASYGDFGKFPREIRDMIYAEYFSVDTPATLEKYLEPSKSEAILYVTKPDSNILRVSCAIYTEAMPVGTPTEILSRVTDIGSFGGIIVKVVDYSASQRISQSET
jgi:hypothetical protein